MRPVISSSRMKVLQVESISGRYSLRPTIPRDFGNSMAVRIASRAPAFVFPAPTAPAYRRHFAVEVWNAVCAGSGSYPRQTSTDALIVIV